MSTHAFIAAQQPNGTVRAIYLHSDGYVQHAGQTLVRHYMDPAKINALLDLGDLSVLGAELGEKHNFNFPPKGVCNAYMRDREEVGFEAQTYRSRQSLADAGSNRHITYVYIFDGERWLVYLDGIQYGSMVVATSADPMSEA